jgi:HEPN domain-containing protein
MKVHILSVLLIIVLLIPTAYAADIVLSVNQSDYYFLTGDEAVVPLVMDNTYGKSVNGQLSYTITQQINQQGFQYTSSNTQSTSFSVDEGTGTINLGFGTSDTPMTMNVGLTFSYTEKEHREVTLQDIKLHFVSQSSEIKNEQNSMQSSSQTVDEKNQQQDPSSESNQPNPQELLQNNQISQDSSALKQQIEQQAQQQQQLNEEFLRQLALNEEFVAMHQELQQQGYNVSSASVNPTANNSGTFEINYEKEDGDRAVLEGEMQNGKMKELQKQTSRDQRDLLELLTQDKRFKEYEAQLTDEGYMQQNIEFSQEGNATNIQLQYSNEDNSTAVITAQITNNTVDTVELYKEDDSMVSLWFWLLLLMLITITGYLIYKKYLKKPDNTDEAKPVLKEQPFDYTSAAEKMIAEAVECFENGDYKEAYGKAGQALRLFISYENKLNKELTNDEVIDYLKEHGMKYEQVEECFELCSLVEFAKYKASREDFDMIISAAKEVIKRS